MRRVSLRGVVGVVGELLVTAGLVVLLFVVWQIGYVGLVETRAQAATVGSIEQAFAQGHSLDDLAIGPGADPTVAADPHSGDPNSGDPHSGDPSSGAAGPGSPAGPVIEGQVLAILRIPRLDPDWARPVYEGVGAPVLARGIGHYPGTALAGEIGNLGLAGHRAGSGNPLLHIDRLVAGDAIVIETRQAYAVYRVRRHDIVPPTAVEVIAPVPGRPGVAPTEAWLTLTSCDPPFSAARRYIVFAQLEGTYPRAAGLPPGTLDGRAAPSRPGGIPERG